MQIYTETYKGNKKTTKKKNIHINIIIIVETSSTIDQSKQINI